MGIIKPTITLTANASSATTDAGPMSIALSLSATDSLDVTEVGSKIMDVSATHALVWDASDYTASAVYGEDGGFMYFKNMLAENSPADKLHDIIIHTGDADADGNGHADRFFTLQPGEFAWMPWDMTQDIYVDAIETNTSALECWLFVRTTTA
mgnify:CR=1 FL=1